MLRTKPAKISMLVCILLVIATVSFSIVKALERSEHHPELVLEAGSALPEAAEFFLEPEIEASYSSGHTEVDLHKPGPYPLEIKASGKTYAVTLLIIDTIAPVASLRQLDLLPGQQATPEDFLISLHDETAVTVSFASPPDFSLPDRQAVEIVLLDAGGNKATYQTWLRISPLQTQLTLEAEPAGIPQAQLLLKETASAGIVRWSSPPPALNQPDEYTVTVNVDGADYQAQLTIRDTIAPQGQTKDLAGWAGDEFEPADFITEITDATAVVASFAVQPDFARPGRQEIQLALTDAGHNTTILTAYLDLTADTEPPVIYGAQKVTLYIGQTATYKKGVYAVDNRDGEVMVDVDTSQVNPRQAGQYTALYSATDRAGNTSQVEVLVSVLEEETSLAELNEIADRLLAEITTEDMDDYTKAWHIYDYISTNLSYSGYSDKNDWMSEAKRGFTKKSGDCFTSYAMSHLLLGRIGMQTLSVERERKPGESEHYWHMVRVGDEWYHFDAGKHGVKLESFMLTTRQLEEYSARVGRDSYYYRFTQDQYPKTPDEPINDPTVPGMH